MPLPSLKYIHTEGKVSFLPVEGQCKKIKIGVFGSRDMKEVSALKQPRIHPEMCRTAGGRSPSLYGERPKIAKDSCRGLAKKGSEPALLLPCDLVTLGPGQRPSARRDVVFEVSLSGKKPIFHQF